ncbi:hypothetical protein MVES1_002652 [Malassezia vespertilionis]|nr:uncharacterized protein MVES1_002652 [Malassezia vespertilionis]WFD07291.1 hypothetical protein MVES1_002652 [Malassezia vespertilionis]
MGDTSYDTSAGSNPQPKSVVADHGYSHALDTDIDESDTEATHGGSFASRMRPRATKKRTSPAPLFFPESEEEGQVQSPRQSRMDKLRALAQKRASVRQPLSEEDVAASSVEQNVEPNPPLLEEVESDSSVDLEAAAPKARPIKGLSRKEQREMHSMSAALRRKQRSGVARREPKKYPLSELLSIIQHTESAVPEMQSRAGPSSDPVESSSSAGLQHSTPERAFPRQNALPVAGGVFTDSENDRLQRKWAMLKEQQPAAEESDSDLEVVSLHPQAQQRNAHFRAAPNDLVREAAEASFRRLDASPVTPRTRRVATSEYRSPDAGAPSVARITDEQMNVSAHTFALAAEREVGKVPLSSPVRVDEGAAHNSPVRLKQAPVVMDQVQLNATLLRKTQEQNAKIAETKQATRHYGKRASTEAPDTHADSDMESDVSVHADEPESGENDSSGNSEKENVPLPPANEPDVGRFCVPTQRASPENSALLRTLQSRTDSNSSVLAQFFENTPDQSQRGASLDLFANQRRAAPVGGMTQFFDPTPLDTSRSQEAMPPPRSKSGDGFAALRHAQAQEANALLSPEMLPSLDPFVEHGDEPLHEQSRRPSASQVMMYINPDGFFTQTKPDEFGASQNTNRSWLLPSQMGHETKDMFGDAPRASQRASFDEAKEGAFENVSDTLSMPDSDEESDTLAADTHAKWAHLLSQPKPAKKHRPKNAFVYGEAEESEDEEHNAEHGGLAGVFSDHASEDEEGSDDDADLESLLDDDREEDENEKNQVALERYLQHRDEDDAAALAVHERAIKGMLRSRRRRQDDTLGDLLDEDADEDELRRKLCARKLAGAKRRRIDGDGMDELASRQDAQAFLHAYNESHATEETMRYGFLEPAMEASDDEERVTMQDIRTQLQKRIRQEQLEAESTEDEASVDEDAFVQEKLRERHRNHPVAAESDDEAQHERLLFKQASLDLTSLPPELREKRERILEEYSNEPNWREERGGRGGIDRRRKAQGKQVAAPLPAPRPSGPVRSAPSVLVSAVLHRTSQFDRTHAT